MSRFLKAACCVLAFVIMATVTLPVKSMNTMAAETEYIQVSVTDGEMKSQYTTTAMRVEEFLKQNNIRLYSKDICNQEMSNDLWDGMEIVISRGVNVSVNVDGKWEERLVKPGTTAEQLQTLLQNEYDKAYYNEGKPDKILKDGDSVVLYTWHTETVKDTEPIPFETLETETNAVMEGKSYVRQEGLPGLKEITTAIIYIGGKVSRRSVIDERVLLEPVMKLIDVGTGGALGTTINTSLPEFRYIKKMTMNASAYTAGFESTGKNPGDPGYGRTAMGLQVKPGIVSVDPAVIPLGTKLYVEGYGFSLAADTGSAIKGNKIDLFYESLEDAIHFGRKNLDVYVLE